MALPAWRLIAEKVAVPGVGGIQWTCVLDYAPPGRVLKISVIDDEKAKPPVTGEWQPKDCGTKCSADGDFINLKTDNSLVIPTVARGALIGRIGGGSPHQTIEPPAPTIPITPARVVFPVGRVCVLKVPLDLVGALFLGINDCPTSMGSVVGSLSVNVFEALL